VDQVTLAADNALVGIGQIPSNLVHPQSIRRSRNPSDLDLSCREFNEEQDDEALQPVPGPHLDCEEIGSHNQFPVSGQKLFPRRLTTALWRWFDAVPLENRCDRAARNLVAQIGQGALDAPIAPVPVLFGHSDHQSLNHAGGARSSRFAITTAIILQCN